MKPSPNDELNSEETEQRRETALKRMLATPPQPHGESRTVRKPKKAGAPDKTPREPIGREKTR